MIGIETTAKEFCSEGETLDTILKTEWTSENL
jgi:hypothetical protein